MESKNIFSKKVSDLTMKKHSNLFKNNQILDSKENESEESLEANTKQTSESDKIPELPGHRIVKKVINDKLMSSGYFSKTKELREEEELNGRGVIK